MAKLDAVPVGDVRRVISSKTSGEIFARPSARCGRTPYLFCS
jgi:hypothetical protein